MVFPLQLLICSAMRTFTGIQTMDSPLNSGSRSLPFREQGLKLDEIAENLNCSVSVVKKWIRRYREGDIIADKSRAPLHREVKNTQFNQHMVKEILEKFPFYGSRRIAHTIEKEIGVTVSHVTVSQMMKDIQEKKEPVVAEKIEIAEPDAIWHMDMTPKRIARGNIQYIFGVIDAAPAGFWQSRTMTDAPPLRLSIAYTARSLTTAGRNPVSSILTTAASLSQRSLRTA